MENLYNVVPVQEHQIDILRALAHETFVDTFASMNTPENIASYTLKTFSQKQVSSELNVLGSSFFFACFGDDIAGYLKLNTGAAQTEQDLPNAMEIERIYAKRSFLGKGVGKALMQKSIAEAKSANLDWLWLGVWEENERAIEFYKRQSFQIFGQHDFFMGDELQRDILMKLLTTTNKA